MSESLLAQGVQVPPACSPPPGVNLLTRNPLCFFTFNAAPREAGVSGTRPYGPTG